MQTATSLLSSLLLGFLLTISVVTSGLAQTDLAPVSKEDLKETLRQLEQFPPNPCDLKPEDAKTEAKLNSQLYVKTLAVLEQDLNNENGSSSIPLARVEASLVTLFGRHQGEDSEHTASPVSYELLDLRPILVLKLSVHSQERLFVLEHKGQRAGQNPRWQAVDLQAYDDDKNEAPISWRKLALVPLYSGKSSKMRFLSSITRGGCAGSFGVSYSAYEWDPENTDGALEKVIDIHGFLGSDNKVPDFPQIGRLKTAGTLITLPYCQFSVIDTWDNPSLCMVDTYNLSTRVSFQNRRYNRPDLVPVIQIFKHIGDREYPAIRAYTSSDAIANRILKELQPRAGSEEIKTRSLRSDLERITLSDLVNQSTFIVRKMGKGWKIVGFKN